MTMSTERVSASDSVVDSNSSKTNGGGGDGGRRRSFRVLIAVTVLAAVSYAVVETGVVKRVMSAAGASEAAASSSAAAPPPAVSLQPPQPPPVQTPTMPGGWRDLKFGMTEKEVAKIVGGYRAHADIPWKKSEMTFLPTVRLASRSVDYLPVDEKRYHHFSIRDLDDGASTVEAWHNEAGELIAIQVRGRADPNVFFERASEAYAARPQNTKFRFFDDRTKMQQSRELSIWHGTEMTALLWTVTDTAGMSPLLLLWSNAAMATRETEFQSSLDAPSDAVRKAAKAGELGTKF